MTTTETCWALLQVQPSGTEEELHRAPCFDILLASYGFDEAVVMGVGVDTPFTIKDKTYVVREAPKAPREYWD